MTTGNTTKPHGSIPTHQAKSQVSTHARLHAISLFKDLICFGKLSVKIFSTIMIILVFDFFNISSISQPVHSYQ